MKNIIKNLMNSILEMEYVDIYVKQNDETWVLKQIKAPVTFSELDTMFGEGNWTL